MLKTVVCEIEKYATHDGPGIRSVVFLKGCPLRCLWCANPETQAKENQIYYNAKKCIQCGRCGKVCEKSALSVVHEQIHMKREQCIACGQCVKACPVGALQLVGKVMSVEEVFEEVNKDIVFYQQSRGGVTISGGEVLLQEEFVAALLKKCQENYIHTAIETSGFGSWYSLIQVAQYCDLILFDIKHTNSDIHKELTGVDNKLILDNLHKLSQCRSHIVIRVPLITGLNDSVENIKNVAAIAKDNDIREVQLLPYHSLGREKYKQLGREYDLENIKTPEDIKVNHLQKVVEDCGLTCLIGG